MLSSKAVIATGEAHSEALVNHFKKSGVALIGKSPWVHALLGLLLVACSGGGSGFGGGGKRSAKKAKDPAAPQPTVVADVDSAAGAMDPGATITSIDDFGRALETAIHAPGAFEAMAATPMTEILRDPHEWANNDSIEFFGYTVDGMLDKLTSEKMDSARQATLTNYATFGEYLESLGVYSAADIDLTAFGDTMANFEQYFANPEAMEADESSGQDAGEAGDSWELSLAGPPSAGEFINKEGSKSCDHSAQDSRNFGHMCGHCMRENDIPKWNRVKADNHCLACKAEEGATIGNWKRGCVNNLPEVPDITALTERH